ncbi:MAG: hypothetical protein A2X58_10185 [Nitrospirae bacterium GWC2_56_14]|nr:MAG: hypothetical protein A2X58_10185 [Nitrospirae bacterium GWC2_56_14]
MKKQLTRIGSVLLFIVLSAILASSAFATNGMNLEGYGPIATGMGGASMAYDNGAAAVMNNPATLGLMEEGDRLDVALGLLGPNITAKRAGAPDAKSSADAFFMPAFGWVRKAGSMSYGVGMFSQGGMGTEYDANSFMALGSGEKVRSELGVGRVIAPLAYNVTPDLTIGGSIDFVWASLDLKMAVPGPDFIGMVTNCSGPACAGLGPIAAAPWTRLDFSGKGDFSGAATGTGLGGKLGIAYKVNSDVSIGAVYHSKTSLSDLETKGDGAAISASGMGTVGTGKISVRDFQWPETYGVGVSWTATKELQVVADIKRINWSDVMKSFKMTYEGPLAGAPGNTVDFAMPQNWKNQTVYELGVAYRVSNLLTLRTGVNLSSNLIPDTYLNALFPATIRNHYTIGAGYIMSRASSVDASFAYAPEVRNTSGQTITVSHSQNNAQLMYSYRF